MQPADYLRRFDSYTHPDYISREEAALAVAQAIADERVAGDERVAAEKTRGEKYKTMLVTAILRSLWRKEPSPEIHECPVSYATTASLR